MRKEPEHKEMANDTATQLKELVFNTRLQIGHNFNIILHLQGQQQPFTFQVEAGQLCRMEKDRIAKEAYSNKIRAGTDIEERE